MGFFVFFLTWCQLDWQFLSHLGTWQSLNVPHHMFCEQSAWKSHHICLLLHHPVFCESLWPKIDFGHHDKVFYILKKGNNIPIFLSLKAPLILHKLLPRYTGSLEQSTILFKEFHLQVLCRKVFKDPVYTDTVKNGCVIPLLCHFIFNFIFHWNQVTCIFNFASYSSLWNTMTNFNRKKKFCMFIYIF